MCFDRISFAHLHLAKQKVQSHWLKLAVALAKTCIANNKEATSSTRLDRYDPQTILSCLTSLWAVHLQTYLADELLTERLPLEMGEAVLWHKSHLRRGGQTYLAAKIHPKTRYFLQGLEISENTTPTERWTTACSEFLHPPRRKYLFCLCFLVWEREVEQVVCPNSRCSRATLEVWREDNFKMDTGEECIPEETWGWQKWQHEIIRNPVKKSCKISHGALVVSATRTPFIERKIQIEQLRQTTECRTPATNRHPMKGPMRRKGKQAASKKTEPCLLFEAGVYVFPRTLAETTTTLLPDQARPKKQE